MCVCSYIYICVYVCVYPNLRPYVCMYVIAIVRKSVPLQAWSGPVGSRKLRFLDLMPMAQGGGKVVSHTHLPHLPPGNSPGTHFC